MMYAIIATISDHEKHKYSLSVVTIHDVLYGLNSDLINNISNYK